MLNSALSMLYLAVAAWLLTTLSQGAVYFGLLVSLYLLTLRWLPQLVLAVLPVSVVLVDSTPWFGWRLFNELDVIVLVSIAGTTLFSPRISRAAKDPQYSSGADIPRTFIILCSVWLLSWLVATVSNTTQWQLPALAVSDVFYFTAEYGISLIKAIAYSFLLWRMWISLCELDRDKSVRWLLGGFAAAGVTLFVIVAWERGVFGSLFSGGPYYYRLQPLLDFTSSYRVTGMFSSMHTGGETIDGFIIIAISMIIAGLFYYRGMRQLVFVFALGLLLYSLLVTFTRTTYVSFVVIACVAGLYGFAGNNHGAPKFSAWLAYGVVFLCLSGLFYYLHRASGYMGLVIAYGILTFGLLRSSSKALHHLNRWLVALVYALAILGGVYAQLTSKWVPASAYSLATVTVALLLLSACADGMGRQFKLSIPNMVMLLAAIVMISFVLLTLLGSTRMTERLKGVDGDVHKRLSHWTDVMAARTGGVNRLLFGMGPGSFPEAYAVAHPDKLRSVGSFLFSQTGIRLGIGNDLKLAQRVNLSSQHAYKVRVVILSPEKGALEIALCERNHIFASNFVIPCSSHRLPLDASPEPQEFEFLINTDKVGEGSIRSRWPTVFQFNNRGNSIITVQNVALYTEGENILRNGDFSQGQAYWYFYNDFQHLPWHIKNIPLSLFFELGLFGLISTAALVLYALKGSATAALGQDHFALGGCLVLIGMAVIGLMGNPLDTPRIAMLFYWLVLIIATWPRTLLRR